MYTVKLNDTQFDNLKHVLFGLQKQANVINEAVIIICADGLAEQYGDDIFNSEDAIVESIGKYLNNVMSLGPDHIRGSKDDIMLIRLLSGEQSFVNLLVDGPKYVHIEQPNPDSPKRNFRILMLGEVPEKDRDVVVNKTDTNTAKFNPDEKPYDESDDFQTRVDKLRNAILPMVPAAVKAEVPDEYAQALCCAEYYYRYNS